MEVIKVAIADASALLCDGLKRILSLEKDFLVVGDAHDGNQAVEIVGRLKPHVLLLDFMIPQVHPVQILLELNQENARTKVLILSVFPEAEHVLSTARAGAWGYVLKSTPAASLIRAIRSVHGGNIWVDRTARFADAFVELARQKQASQAGGSRHGVARLLSKREREILALTAEGRRNREISKRLLISEATVKAHLNRIFHKLEVDNRTKAALLFIHGAYQQESNLKAGRTEERWLYPHYL